MHRIELAQKQPRYAIACTVRCIANAGSTPSTPPGPATPCTSPTATLASVCPLPETNSLWLAQKKSPSTPHRPRVVRSDERVGRVLALDVAPLGHGFGLRLVLLLGVVERPEADQDEQSARQVVADNAEDPEVDGVPHGEEHDRDAHDAQRVAAPPLHAQRERAPREPA